MLIASREDVDASSAWNHHLLNAVPEAFLQTVHVLNRGEIRYKWPKYLPDQRTGSGFFERLAADLLRTLAGSKVIESRSGEFMLPCALKYVSANYRDGNDEPLVRSDKSSRTYISER